MPMNQVIFQRRRALGLTQEQLAERLCVTAPAVNKWEKGVCCPDISLIPALARLLGVDLNTLFCFHENLDEAEIDRISIEVKHCADTQSLSAAFSIACMYLKEYPRCDALRYKLTVLLDGLKMLSSQEEPQLEAQIFTWYELCLKSDDDTIRRRAAFMLAGRCLRDQKPHEAQRLLNLLPCDDGPDKRLLQAELFLQQKDTDAAARLMASSILSTANTLQHFLWKLIDIETQCGESQLVERMTDISRRFGELFEL